MRILLFSLFACTVCMWAQSPGSDASSELSGRSSASARAPELPVDALTPDVQTTPNAQSTNALATAPPFDRPVSWLKLPENIEQDQRAMWLAPLKLKDSNYWIPAAAVVSTTVVLAAFDPKTGHFFRNASMFNRFNNVFKGQYTARGLWIAPFALYGAGWVTNDSKMTSTALLAGEAVADSEILTTVLKDIDRRKRPMDLPANGNFSASWFDGKAGGLQGNGSFPSGHTIAAFSIATVIARRYGNHKWVPYVAYGTAALIGFSRLTLSSHWSSDVFVGGVLGYTISRYTVLQQ